MKKLLLLTIILASFSVRAQRIYQSPTNADASMDITLGGNQEALLFGFNYIDKNEGVLYGFLAGSTGQRNGGSYNGGGYYRDYENIVAFNYGRQIFTNVFLKGSTGASIGARTYDGYFPQYHGGNLASFNRGETDFYGDIGIKLVPNKNWTAEVNYGTMGVGINVGFNIKF